MKAKQIRKLLKKRNNPTNIIRQLEQQITSSDTYQRVSSFDPSNLIIGIFDYEGLFIDYHDCINTKHKSLSNCYRILIKLNNKIPCC